MKEKFYKGLVSTIITFIMAIAMIAIIYATVSVDNKSVLGYRLFIVATGSMSGNAPDSLNQGDLIIAKNIPFNNLKIDDVITFVSNEPNIYGRINTHRIKKIIGNLIYTQGDANREADTIPVSPDRILGKVIFHSWIAGFIIGSLSKPINMMLFLVIPIVYIAISDLRQTIKKSRKARDKDTIRDEQAVNQIKDDTQDTSKDCNEHPDNLTYCNDSDDDNSKDGGI